MRWRYLTLGFGDQMAWLSANSLAASVDGNYHSARRLPELTSRPVERLENAKFSGVEGLASLNDFLTRSEKYSLKYVFSNDRYYDPLLYYTGWNRTIRLENGITVWEKGNISTIQPLLPTEISPVLKYAWGILPLSSLGIAFMLTIVYLSRFKDEDYFASVPPEDQYYPMGVIYTASFLPLIFSSIFMCWQVYELLLIKEQRDPVTTVTHYYNHLDFQRFDVAFRFFKPSPTYTLDQYLLEKSVNDGGLLPSYAKLDSISVIEVNRQKDSSNVEVYTRWNTSIGHLENREAMQLIYEHDKWFLVPPVLIPQIPEEQVRSHTYTLFRKHGKRVISSFPTVKDDRIKKPFASFKQANFVRHGSQNFLVGELLNADNIPINVALKVKVRYRQGEVRNYFPTTAFQYNIAPKGSSFFQIDLEDSKVMDSLQIAAVELYAETDVSERGYIHGGTPGYAITGRSDEEVLIKIKFYNELTTDINIPGVLIAEKDDTGAIWQTRLHVHPAAIRSGFRVEFEPSFEKIQHKARMMTNFPLRLYINGQQRQAGPLQLDEVAMRNRGIAILPHCFISDEIYLH